MTVPGKFIGRVKWFNSRNGYGFVTVAIDGEDNDIFVHQSHITPAKEQYRYLVEGEYISLDIHDASEEAAKSDADDTSRSRHAKNVTGVNGGKLMCETRNENRARSQNESGKSAPHAEAEADGEKGEAWITSERRAHGTSRARRGNGRGRGGGGRGRPTA